MPVAGLVLTLSDDDDLRSFALDALGADARLTVGETQRRRKLPVVAITDSLDEQQDLWRTLGETPGVLSVDLAFEDFSDVGEFASGDLPSRWNRKTTPRGDGHGSA
jgi:hypothetical protein